MSNCRDSKVKVGMRFNTLIVLARVPKTNRSQWLVRCDCGNEKVMQYASVRRAKSCGCLTKQILRDAQTLHGHAIRRTATYIAWRSMRARCLKPSHKSWPDYGGRGIKICDSWLKFENFLADMGEKPAGMQLDRVDNNGNYEPSNCRWATPMQNCNNRRSSHFIEFRGERRSVSQWARATGIPRDTLSFRLENGWSITDALTIPVKRQRNNRAGLPATRTTATSRQVQARWGHAA